MIIFDRILSSITPFYKTPSNVYQTDHNIMKVLCMNIGTTSIMDENKTLLEYDNNY